MVKGSQSCEPFSLIRYKNNKSERITYYSNEVRIYCTWQGHKDSNSGHAVLETAALPAELYPYTVPSVTALIFYHNILSFAIHFSKKVKISGNTAHKCAVLPLFYSYYFFCPRAIIAPQIMPQTPPIICVSCDILSVFEKRS